MKLTPILLLGAIAGASLLIATPAESAEQRRTTSVRSRSSHYETGRVYRGRLAPRYSDRSYYGRTYVSSPRYVTRRAYVNYYDSPYYDDYYYRPSYYGPSYYGPSYYGPAYSSGLSFSFGRGYGGRGYGGHGYGGHGYGGHGYGGHGGHHHR